MGRLEKELDRFFKTKKGQALIRKSANGILADVLPNYVSTMQNIIKKKMEAYGLGEYAEFDVKIINTANKDGESEADISFKNSGDAISPSLAPDKYKEGVILGRLMNAGYDANGVVHGYWQKRGVYITSRQKFEGYHFLEDAVVEFNASTPDYIRAIYIERSAKP